MKNITKNLAGFSSLVEKGFLVLGYFLCSCAWCMVFLLVILVAATLLSIVKLNDKME
jgi:hypothetical protein